MEVGYDAKRLFHNHTGLGYYSRTLIQSLSEADPEFRATLFDANPVVTAQTELFHDHEKYRIVKPGIPAWYYRSVRINKYLDTTRVSLFHGLSNELPYLPLPSSIPAVVTIHDVLFKSFRADFPWHDRWIYQFKTRVALERADLVVAISEATKEDILRHFKVAENKIRVIYQSYDPVFDQPVSEGEVAEVLASYRLPAEYLLYVGSVTYRKNLMVILRALQAMEEKKRIPLLVAGKGKDYQKRAEEYIRQHQLENWVHFLPDLPRYVLRILYAGAQMLIYPSLGEGFGLPVLEGIAANIPVITSNRSSLPEAGGEAAHYFNPEDHGELKELILKVTRSDSGTQSLTRRTEHLHKFNKNRIARQYLQEIYGTLIRH